MHVINVRPETAEDIRAIDVVHISAFGGEAEARLVSALRESTTYNRELSLVAELGGRIVGHALLTRVPMRKDGTEKNVLALGPMSVVPSQSHRGIGSELINASVSLAKEKGYGTIVVMGHPEYYKRFGFSSPNGLQHEGVPQENFLALSFCNRIPTGIVEFHEAFSATE